MKGYFEGFDSENNEHQDIAVALVKREYEVIDKEKMRVVQEKNASMNSTRIGLGVTAEQMKIKR
jgi:hypothetical protein